MNHYEKSNFEVSNGTVCVTVYYTSVKDDILILQMNDTSYLLLFIHMNTYVVRIHHITYRHKYTHIII